MEKTSVWDIGNFTIRRIVTGFFKENCYMISHKASEFDFLIDPGENSFHLLADSLQESRFKKILLTHGHFDHVADLISFYEKFKTIASVHKNESKLLRQAQMYSIRYIGKIINMPKEYNYFDETTETLRLSENLNCKILPTPGHTSGSVCYYFEDGFVFTGDTLFFNHIGPTGYPESNLDALKKSVDFILDYLPNETIIFSGHGRPWTIGQAKDWWITVRENPPQYHIMNDSSL